MYNYAIVLGKNVIKQFITTKLINMCWEGSLVVYKNPKPVLDDDRLELEKESIYGEASAEYKKVDNIYFAYIDVLGFKQTFDENRKNTRSPFARKYERAFQYYSFLMNRAKFVTQNNYCNAGQTSDSLYFYTDRIDFMIKFIRLYSHFSLYAMTENVFFRGGIAKGNLFISQPHQFYGDSVIKAYLLENSIAKYPHVAIDEQTYKELSKNKDAVGMIECDNGRNYIKPFIYIDLEELRQLIDAGEDSIHNIDITQWEKIGAKIRYNKRRFEFDDKNYLKYNYLLNQYQKLSPFEKAKND